MTIKLKGSTDGSVSLQAPADTSPTGTDITLTLPTTAGSADQFVKNSGTAGTLEYSSMVETSTGVGIGTSSPTAQLHVAATSGTTIKIEDNDNGFDPIEISATNGGRDFTFTTNQDYYFKQGASTTFMTIQNGGNVGIGTDSPQTKLEVDNGTPTGTLPTLGGLLVTNAGTSSSSAAMCVATGSGPIFNVMNDGNVGIGTSSPNSLLELSESGGPSLRFTNPGVRTWSLGLDGTNANADLRFRDVSGSKDAMYIARSTGRVGIGTNSPGSTLDVNGSLSKNSGSFKIDHPLPALTETHHLVHSFVEAPDASNLYAGMVDLVDGTATVNIDTAHRMTEGTFEALNHLQSWSSSNESGYAPVKCSISGNLLTIECQDPTSTDTVYYEVRGIRKDQHMLDTEWTDENGRVITEPVKQSDNTEAAS